MSGDGEAAPNLDAFVEDIRARIDADGFVREPVSLEALAREEFDPDNIDYYAALVREARWAEAKRREANPTAELDSTPVFEPSTALDAALAVARAKLGWRFNDWYRTVLMRAALDAKDRRSCVLRTHEANTDVDRILEVLVERHVEAGIYRRADMLGLVVDDGTSVRFRRVPWETLARHADRVLALFEPTVDKKTGQPSVVRMEAFSLRKELSALLGGDLSAIPALQGFAFGAVLRPDGTVFEGEGFDPASGYYARAGARAPLPEPTPEHARAALRTLLEPFVDFPFEGLATGRRPTVDELVGNPHAVGVVAAILTAVCRSAFSGPAPAFLLEANVQGAGKSLLLQTIATVAVGAQVSATPLAENEEERRKAILAKLIEGDPVIALDNARGVLGGPALEAVLTAEWFSDRVLGQSNSVRERNQALWIITSNNATVTSDMARRVQPVRLSYPAERPEDRDPSAYAIPDLKTWVREHRARLWSAAIAIVRAYILAGRPSKSSKGYGSFEGWDRTIRHALLWCGAADPDQARQAFRAHADIERDALAEALHALRTLSLTRHSGGPFSAQDVLKACVDEHGRETQLLLSLRDVGVRGAPTTRGIGKALAGIRDRVSGGMRLGGKPDRNGVMQWNVAVVTTSAASSVVTSGISRGWCGVDRTRAPKEKSIDSSSFAPLRSLRGLSLPSREGDSVEDGGSREGENFVDGEQPPQTQKPLHGSPPAPLDRDTDDMSVVVERKDGTYIVLHGASKGRG